MRLLPFLVGLTVLASAASAQTTLQGHDEYREPGFVALAFVISDSTFFDRWEEPTPPHIESDTQYRRGETTYPIVIFQSDAVDSEGHAALTYDLAVTRPDGTPYMAPLLGLVAWEGGPTPGLTLALQQATLRVEDDDPLGVYELAIMLHDRIRGQSVSLALSFEVSE